MGAQCGPRMELGRRLNARCGLSILLDIGIQESLPRGCERKLSEAVDIPDGVCTSLGHAKRKPTQ